MLALIGTWWAVCLLLSVPSFANQVAVVIARRTQSKHDFAIDDDLPQTAGEWLRDRIATGALRSIVTDARAKQSTNGYYFYHRVIQLTEETHFKADPTYWAIAAHELGHARLHLHHPDAAAMIEGAGMARWVLAMVAIGLGVGNLLYALPGVTDFCFMLCVLALAFHASELVNEATASLFAYAELRRSAHLTPRHLRAVRAVLWSAFGTYGITYLAHALLLTQWSHVERVTGGGRLGDVARLTTLGWIGAVVASVFAVLYAVVVLLHVVRRDPRPEDGLVTLVGKLAIAGLVYLAWNLRSDAGWAWAVMLAMVPIGSTFVGVLLVPTVPLQLFFARLMKHVSGPGIHKSAEWERARRAGRRMIQEGNDTLGAMLARIRPHPGAWLRGAVMLLYLPLLLMFWLT